MQKNQNIILGAGGFLDRMAGGFGQGYEEL
jgi:hypothetical protein